VSTRPIGELVGLADALIEEAERRKVGLRLLGGVAVWLSSPTGRAVHSLQRGYNDLDFVAVRKGSGALPAVFATCGWEADARFNTLHGKTRLLFFHGGDLQADIFLGEFEQCHKLDIGQAVLRVPRTMPPAELLLTKLQVRQPNEKDITDTLSLLLDHDFGAGSGAQGAAGDDGAGARELDAIRRVTGSDWGWYATCVDSLAVMRTGAERLLAGDAQATAIARIDALASAIEATPKSTGWRLRATIGRRMAWYEEPEEVNR
jgi:hypothetical protein